MAASRAATPPAPLAADTTRLRAAHKRRHHEHHLLFSYWFGTTDPCPAQTLSKQRYAERHGYGWQFDMVPLKTPIRRGEESPQLAETVWYKVDAMLRLFADNGNATRCTFLDSDTLVLRPDRSLESIFAQTRAPSGDARGGGSSLSVARRGPRCSVDLQADPMMLNAGFVSVRRTRWVLESFLPTWLSYSRDPHFYFRSRRDANFHAPEQAALVATVLHFALRSVPSPDRLAPLLGAEERRLLLAARANSSLHVCTDPDLRAEMHAKAVAYFAAHPELPDPSLRGSVGTMSAYMAKMRRPTHRLYACAAGAPSHSPTFSGPRSAD